MTRNTKNRLGRRGWRAIVGLAAAATVGSALSAQAAPGERDGARYSMSPVDGGFVRLDRQTGAMSICRQSNDAWSCTPMDGDDGDAQSELDRLKAENAELKDEIRRMEEVFGLDGRRPEPGRGPESDGPLAGPPGGPPGRLPEFQLPSEKDVDRAVDYLEGMIRKFRERFEDFGDKTDPDRPRRPDERDQSSQPDEPRRL